MHTQNPIESCEAQERTLWCREERAKILDAWDDCVSLSAFAVSVGVPRTTLRDWLERREELLEECESREEVLFFESAAGCRVLHRLLIAAHVMMGLVGQGGIRLIGQFFEHAGLGLFVATSYSAQRRYAQALQGEVVAFGKQQTQMLGACMERKSVTLCGDETFHQEGACLVAIEPVSNFILLEKHEKQRDAATWTRALDEACAPLHIEVVQWCADMASQFDALCAQQAWHKSPDLMHVQQPLVKRSARALGQQTHESEKLLRRARERVEQMTRRLGEAGAQTQPECRALAALRDEAAQALRDAEQKATQQAHMSELTRDLSRLYQPFNTDTGELRDETTLEVALKEKLDDILEHGTACGLQEKFVEAVHKLKRWSTQMVATLSFFWTQVHEHVAALELVEEVVKLFVNIWLATEFVAMAGARARSRDERCELRKLEGELRAQLTDNTLYCDLGVAERARLQEAALWCAGLWQRSSSCVEGRNGYLALKHHALRRLSPQKLTALTTIHNFFIKRRDGTTPAARFFGQHHDDLFEHLRHRLKRPPRPAAKRHQADIRKAA